MPLHMPTYPDEAFDSLPVESSSKEAVVLKTVREDPHSSVETLASAVDLDEEAVRGALYRLREKDLVVKRGDEYDLESYVVVRLADALRPSPDLVD